MTSIFFDILEEKKHRHQSIRNEIHSMLPDYRMDKDINPHLYLLRCDEIEIASA